MSAPVAVLQPSSDTSIYYRDGSGTQQPYYAPISDFMSVARSFGYNTILMWPSYWNYYQESCYQSIVAFNLPDNLTDWYIANTNFISDTDTGMVFVQDLLNSSAVTTVNLIKRNGTWQINGSSNYYTMFGSGITSKDNVTYRKKTSDYTSNVDLPIIIYTEATVNVYVNGSLPVTYTWTSVPAISGDNGVRMSLATVADEMIGNGITVQTVIDDDSGFGLPNSAKLYNMLQNLTDGVETICGYCGENYFTLTKQTITTSGLSYYTTIKLYSSMGVLYYSHVMQGYARYSDSLFNEYLGFYIDEENEVALLGTVITYYYDPNNSTTYQYNNYGDASEADMRNIYSWLSGHIVPEPTDPYEGGTTDNGGEDGQPQPQDDLPSNGLPSVDGMNTGMYTVWLPSDTDMLHISNFLWSNDVITNIRKYFNNVGECVLGMYILPYVPDSGISSKKFKIGNLEDSDHGNVSYLTSRYRTVDMGSFNLKAFWDTYLDFAPYTKLEIFLPYCGMHQLDVDELMCPAENDGTCGKTIGGSLSCEYRLDLLTGGVVVYLKLNGKVRYQFSGKMGCNLPVTGNNYSIMVQSLIQGVSGLASTVASHAISAPYSQNPVAPTPPPADAGKQAMKQYNKDLKQYNNQMENRAKSLGHSVGSATGAAAAGIVQSSKPDVIRCGNITGDNSMIGYDRPYLIKTRPNKPELVDQGSYTGFPSYKSGKLSDFGGYTECIKVHLEGVPCTGMEQEQIENMLKSGVIMKDGSATPDVTPTVAGNLVVVLMNMIDEVNVIGKSWTNETKVEGKLIYDNSISEPVILLEGNYLDYNYCYVPFFHRFYYIGDYVVTRQTMEEIHLKVDPLQSFKTEILNSNVMVSRSQKNPNFYLNDGVFYTEQRTVVTYHCFKKDGEIKKFDTQQIYLITAGGD